MCDVPIMDTDGARRGRIKTGDQSQQGRLAAPGRAHDRQELLRGDLEGNVIQDEEFSAPAGKTHRQVADLNHEPYYTEACDISLESL